jgi:hypothetical protein
MSLTELIYPPGLKYTYFPEFENNTGHNIVIFKVYEPYSYYEYFDLINKNLLLRHITLKTVYNPFWIVTTEKEFIKWKSVQYIITTI